MKLKITTIALAGLALVASSQAALITGGVTMSANATTALINPTLDSVKFSSLSNNAKVDSADGDMLTLTPLNSLITYSPFEYDPLAVVNPIWTNGITSFSLTSVTSITENFIGTKFVGLLLFGTGLITTTLPGFEATPGLWSFNASRTNTKFSWGSTATVTAVPDGGATLALLGVSILGLGGTRRLFASKK